MGFESPWLLLGLLGVAVPLLLHWYLRRTAPIVALDAVMLLVLHGAGETRRLRLVHLTLLAVRALIVAGIALMFARPFITVPAAGGVSDHPVAVAIVLDDSMSMRMAGEGGTPWDRARETTLRTLKELPAESSVFLVLASRPVTVQPDDAVGWDAIQTIRYVESLSATRAASDLSAAVRAALVRVRVCPQRDRRVVVISDFYDATAASFPTLDELAGVSVVPVDTSSSGRSRNRAVIDVSTYPAPDLSPGRVRVQVQVANGGAEPMSEVLSVRAGAAAVARRVECPGGARCNVEFVLEVPEGVRVGEARLPPDDLPDDDVRWFSLAPRDRDAVLLVDGSPSRRTGEGAAFFVARALGLQMPDDPGFVVTTIREDELSPLHLAAVGTVGLLNPGPLAPERARALADFVASGGGLFVSVGPNLDLEGWGATFKGLLPSQVRAVLDIGGGVSKVPRVISRVDPTHPAVFGLGGLLAAVKIRRLLLLDDGWQGDSSVIASLDSGQPVLVDRHVGQGSVLVWLSSLDRDWADMPLLPVFAPFIRKSFGYLRDAGGPRPSGAVAVNEPRYVEISSDADQALVRPPSGHPVALLASSAFEGTAMPGIYRVDLVRSGKPDPVRSDVFVVNTDAAESVLNAPAGIPAVFSRFMATEQDQTVASATRRMSLLGQMLVGILLLLLAEAWLRGKS